MKDIPDGAQHSFGSAQDGAAPLHRQVSRAAGLSPGVRGALFALRCYKVYLSVMFGGTCRFEPTCSQYAYEAIERFGVLRGMWLGTQRLLRCHPLSRKFGYDPVPETWEEMNMNEVAARKHSEVRS